MPFSKGCRIEVENQSDIADSCTAYDVAYQEWETCPDNLARFHSCWHRENPVQPGRGYTVLQSTGRGHFVGCNLSVQTLGTPSLSFLEGIDTIHVDGEDEPALKVWGTEDFFGGSFYFCRGPYAGPYSGATVLDAKLGRFAGYRLFIADAITFTKAIRVVINHGEYFHSGPIGDYEGRADYCSVAYWYQTEPHNTDSYRDYSVSERLPAELVLENHAKLP